MKSNITRENYPTNYGTTYTKLHRFRVSRNSVGVPRRNDSQLLTFNSNSETSLDLLCSLDVFNPSSRVKRRQASARVADEESIRAACEREMNT